MHVCCYDTHNNVMGISRLHREMARPDCARSRPRPLIGAPLWWRAARARRIAAFRLLRLRSAADTRGSVAYSIFSRLFPAFSGFPATTEFRQPEPAVSQGESRNSPHVVRPGPRMVRGRRRLSVCFSRTDGGREQREREREHVPRLSSRRVSGHVWRWRRWRLLALLLASARSEAAAPARLPAQYKSRGSKPRDLPPAGGKKSRVEELSNLDTLLPISWTVPCPPPDRQTARYFPRPPPIRTREANTIFTIFSLSPPFSFSLSHISPLSVKERTLLRSLTWRRRAASNILPLANGGRGNSIKRRQRASGMATDLRAASQRRSLCFEILG